MRSLLRRLRQVGAFTLIELLTVMAIIAILAGLILSIAGYAQKKGALARASAEIQALSSGCESYKADNGTYPHQPVVISGGTAAQIDSDLVDPRLTTYANPSTYNNASLELYEALTGDISCSGTGGGPGVKNYIADMKPDVWGRSNPSTAVSGSNPVTFLSDPFGNSYGYSTVASTLASSGSAATKGYNPTFDLWSTGGQISAGTNFGTGQPGDYQLQWVKNW